MYRVGGAEQGKTRPGRERGRRGRERERTEGQREREDGEMETVRERPVFFWERNREKEKKR